MVKEPFAEPFLKNQNGTFGSIVESFIQFVLTACQVRGYQNILKLSCRPLSFIL